MARDEARNTKQLTRGESVTADCKSNNEKVEIQEFIGDRENQWAFPMERHQLTNRHAPWDQAAWLGYHSTSCHPKEPHQALQPVRPPCASFASQSSRTVARKSRCLCHRLQITRVYKP